MILFHGTEQSEKISKKRISISPLFLTACFNTAASYGKFVHEFTIEEEAIQWVNAPYSLPSLGDLTKIKKHNTPDSFIVYSSYFLDLAVPIGTLKGDLSLGVKFTPYKSLSSDLQKLASEVLIYEDFRNNCISLRNLNDDSLGFPMVLKGEFPIVGTRNVRINSYYRSPNSWLDFESDYYTERKDKYNKLSNKADFVAVPQSKINSLKFQRIYLAD